MRIWLMSLLVATLGAVGCVADRSPDAKVASGDAKSPAPKSKAPPRVAPSNALVGKVVRVHPIGKFVVLGFPVGQMPATDQVFSLYRAGLVVGQARISGPQLDDAIVADLLSGEAQPGDEARVK